MNQKRRFFPPRAIFQIYSIAPWRVLASWANTFNWPVRCLVLGGSIMGHGGGCYRRIGQHCLDNITRFITKRISRSSSHWHYSQLCKYGHSGWAKCRGNKARVTSVILFDPRNSKISLKSGVASIYKQHFFAQLRIATGIDLENTVY